MRMLKAKIDALAMSMFEMKLTDPHGRFRWNQLRAKAAIKGYRAFLVKHGEDPDHLQRPTRDVDEVWHLHILSTKRYAIDCQQLFGHFLHHVPSYVQETCSSSDGGGASDGCGTDMHASTCDRQAERSTCDRQAERATCDRQIEYATCDRQYAPVTPQDEPGNHAIVSV